MNLATEIGKYFAALATVFFLALVMVPVHLLLETARVAGEGIYRWKVRRK